MKVSKKEYNVFYNELYWRLFDNEFGGDINSKKTDRLTERLWKKDFAGGTIFTKYFQGYSTANPRYFYVMYRNFQKLDNDTDQLEVDEMSYFKALVYLGVGEDRYPDLNFDLLHRDNRWAKTLRSNPRLPEELNDALTQPYFLEYGLIKSKEHTSPLAHSISSNANHIVAPTGHTSQTIATSNLHSAIKELDCELLAITRLDLKDVYHGVKRQVSNIFRKHERSLQPQQCRAISVFFLQVTVDLQDNFSRYLSNEDYYKTLFVTNILQGVFYIPKDFFDNDLQKFACSPNDYHIQNLSVGAVIADDFDFGIFNRCDMYKEINLFESTHLDINFLNEYGFLKYLKRYIANDTGQKVYCSDFVMKIDEIKSGESQTDISIEHSGRQVMRVHSFFPQLALNELGWNQIRL